MQSRHLRVGHRLGLHARAAAALANLSKAFRSRITVEMNGVHADSRSILSLLMLGAGHGCRLRVTAAGDDEREAMAALEDFFESGTEGGRSPRPC